MMSMGIFTLLMLGLVTSSVFGLKMYSTSKAKLSASDGARIALSKLTDDVRAAKTVRVGTYEYPYFQEIPVGQPQQGNALKVSFSTNATNFILYFRDATDQTLKRKLSSLAEAQTLAHSITNALPFRAEDFAGNVLTNNQNNRVVQVFLNFYQTQYPTNPVGQGQLVEFLKLESRLTRRAIE